RVVPRLSGAYSFVAMDDNTLVGVRDPHGFRPLFLGRVPGGWALAAETPPLHQGGARAPREIAAGAMVVIAAAGVGAVPRVPAGHESPRLCVFEFVYFARPDGELYGRGVYQSRVRMGEQLARQAPAVADLVVPVPESAVPGAQGYARASGIPYGD